MPDKNELGPFSDPERMRRGMRSIRRTKTIYVEGGKNPHPRLVTYDVFTHLVLKSTPIADPREHGWEDEDPANAGQASEIPIRGTDETWNPWDDPA